MEDNKEKQFDVEAVQRSAIEASVKRSTDILDLCSKWGMSERASEFIKSEKSFADVKEAVLEAVEKRSGTEGLANPMATKSFNIKTDASKEEFSVSRALRAAATQDWSKAGYERAVSQDLSANTSRGWSPNSFTIDMNQRADAISVVGTAGVAGNLVETQYRPDKAIDVLWANTILDKLPVDRMTGLQGNAVIPVVTSKATAKMVTEVAALGDAEAIATQTKSISPKEMITKSAFSRMALLQTNPNIDAIVYTQLFKAIGEKLDKMLFNGSVVAGDLTSLLASISGGQVVAGGVNGLAPTRVNLFKLLKVLSDANINMSSVSFASNPGVTYTLQNTLNDTGNTNSGYIIPINASGDTLLGNKLFTSNNVPNNLTKGTGTNLSPIVAGDWSELTIGQWGNVQVEVDTLNGADNSIIFVRSYSFWDSLVKRAEAFAAIKDIITI